MQAVLAQPPRDAPGHVEHEVLLEQAGHPARALVLAPVARVEHDRVEAIEVGGVGLG